MAIGLGITILSGVYRTFQNNQFGSTATIEQKVTSQTGNSSAETKEMTKATEKSEVSFVAKELFSENDCTISLVDGNSEKLTFLYKNNGTESRSFDVHSLAVNGVMLEFTALSAEIPAGSEAKKSFDIGDYWKPDEFNHLAIDNIQVNFWIYSNYYKEFETGVIQLESTDSKKLTYEYDKTQTQSFSNVDVSCHSIGGDKIEIVVTNRTDSYITYDVDNIVINGWSFDTMDLLLSYHYPRFGETYSQCNSMWVLALRNDEMKEKHIDEIEKFECTLKIDPNGDYHHRFETGTITFTK